jgi:hypothetical protein
MCGPDPLGGSSTAAPALGGDAIRSWACEMLPLGRHQTLIENGVRAMDSLARRSLEARV